MGSNGFFEVENGTFTKKKKAPQVIEALSFFPWWAILDSNQ
jgi:hypothetical protein